MRFPAPHILQAVAPGEGGSGPASGGEPTDPASLLIVGSVAFDSVQTVVGKRDEVLGGAASYGSVAASFLAPPRLVGVVGKDFPDEHIEFFRNHKIDTAGIEVADGRTFRWAGRYADDFSTRTTLDTQLNVLVDDSRSTACTRR